MFRRIGIGLVLALILAAPAPGQNPPDRRLTDDQINAMIERFSRPLPPADIGLKEAREQFHEDMERMDTRMAAYRAKAEEDRRRACRQAEADLTAAQTAVDAKQAEVRDLEKRLDASRSELIEAVVALRLAERQAGRDQAPRATREAR